MTKKSKRPLLVTVLGAWFILTTGIRLLQGLFAVLYYLVFPFTRDLVPLSIFLLGLVAMIAGFVGAVLYFKQNIFGLGILLLFEIGGTMQTIGYHLEHGFGLPYGLQDYGATVVMRVVYIFGWFFIVTKLSLLVYSRKYMSDWEESSEMMHLKL